MRVPALHAESFYPSLMESDATYNCFLELADMTVGTFARWAAATFEGAPDERLDDMVAFILDASWTLEATHPLSVLPLSTRVRE